MYGLDTPDDTEYVYVHDYDYRDTPEDRLLLVEISDLLEELEVTILTSGERPVHGSVYGENVDAFVFEIFNQIAYFPTAERKWEQVVRNVDDTLNCCGLFFDQPEFTPLQRHQWHLFAMKLMTRFTQFQLYNPADNTHRYDYHSLRCGTLVLKLFE